jgi:glutamate/tyrosine decarboxylase-like PLP-dependent enzyme/pimeloyl-ACP methyl ester carboxylesterase
MEPLERVVQVRGIALHLVEWKAAVPGGTPVLMLHGLWDDWRVFADLAPHLARERHVAAVDLRGHGQSSKPAAGYSFSDYAADIGELIPVVSDGAVDLVAYSMGCSIALCVARAFPGRVRRLVLADPPVRYPRQMVEAYASQFLALKRRPLSEIMAQLGALYSARPAELIEQNARSLAATANGTLEYFLTDEAPGIDWLEIAGRLDQPHLVLRADPRSGGMLDEADARELARNPRARIIHLEGCGHSIQGERPADFLQLTQAFLDPRQLAEQVAARPPVSEIGLDPDDWSALGGFGHRMLDRMSRHLQTVRERPVWRPLPAEVRQRLDEPLPLAGQGLEAAYQDFLDCIEPYPLGNTHPRFWGWVLGTGAPLGMLTELLTGALNVNPGGNDASQHVETQVLSWLKTLLGYPGEASGLLVSGGSMANILGLAVARQAKAGFDVRKEGLSGRPRMTLYTSRETHGSIVKAAELLGLGRESVREVAVDAEFRVDVQAVRAAVARDRERGERPFCIVGHAGTVNTGTVDDLAALADLARHEDLWFHVDGAFGALAALSPALRPLVSGISSADSLAFDLHKWMHLPYDLGCVLIRSEVEHRRAFAHSVDYIPHAGVGPAAVERPLWDYDVLLSRRFRALGVWMYLKVFGAETFRRLVEQNVDQARYLGQLVDGTAELERLAPAPLNVVTFRYVGRPGRAEEELDRLNQAILDQLYTGGTCVISSTELRGHLALRAAITNHRTRRPDLDLLVSEVVRLGRALDSRPPG